MVEKEEPKIKGQYGIRIQSFDRHLSAGEILDVVVTFIEKNPELANQILRLTKRKNYHYMRICCPFNISCNAFPCETLHCNADTCSNGYCYRQS